MYLQEDEELDTRDRRSWDDDYVLKRQFSALIPAFDPRPGRPNINQTQDFDIPAPGSEVPSSPPVSSDVPPAPKLVLTLSAPCLPGVSGIRLSVACLSPVSLLFTCLLSVSFWPVACPFPVSPLPSVHLSSVSFLSVAYLFPISLSCFLFTCLLSVSFLPVACLFPVSPLPPVHLSSVPFLPSACLFPFCLLFTCLYLSFESLFCLLLVSPCCLSACLFWPVM